MYYLHCKMLLKCVFLIAPLIMDGRSIWKVGEPDKELVIRCRHAC